MIYQICYNQEQEKNCIKGAKVIYNKTLHPSFENMVIAQIAPTIKDDYFGIFSHKFKLKHPSKKYTLDAIMKEAEKVDVLSFFGNHKQKDMVGFMGQNMRANFYELIEVLLKGTGYKIPKKTKFIIYGNTFVAKNDIYQDYVKTLLRPALLNAKKIEDKLMSPSNYKGTDEAIGHFNTKFRVKLTRYPIYPFVFECLFSIYLSNKDYDCKHF